MPLFYSFTLLLHFEGSSREQVEKRRDERGGDAADRDAGTS